jgi:tetratricopeptide (TPR) repeat protein
MLGMIIRALKDAFITGQVAISREDFRAMFISDDVGLFAEDLADQGIDERFRQMIWRSLPGLENAAVPPWPVTTLYQTLSSALQEKRVRKALKMLIPERRYGPRFATLQQHARGLAEGSRPPVPAPITILEIADTPGTGLPLLARACPALRDFQDQPIFCSFEKVSEELTFYEALTLLEDAYGNFNSILHGIANSPARISIWILQRAIDAGRLRVGLALQSQIYFYAINVIASYHAAETAHRVAIEILQSPMLSELGPASKTAFMLALANAKQKSGRVSEATDIYRQLANDNPESPRMAIRLLFNLFASHPSEALKLASAAIDQNSAAKTSERIFMGELCLRAGDQTRAMRAFVDAATSSGRRHEAWAGFANLALRAERRPEWFRYLHRYGKLAGLEIHSFEISDVAAPFWFRTERYSSVADHPSIAVIMTAHNSESTIDHAVKSVLSQTLSNIELWVVDDGSTDTTRARLHRLAQVDPRIRLLFNDGSYGTYVSKNRALRQTNAEYVTFHDSDDWMHPRKLEHQLPPLMKGAVCTTSRWLRMDAEGLVQVRARGYSHLNPASTLLPRLLLNDIGFFDEVRAGADAEFITRIRSRYGRAEVIEVDRCLALGLHHEASLTTAGSAAFDEMRYSPVRLAYTEAWTAWHISQIERGEPIALRERVHTVPRAIAIN